MERARVITPGYRFAEALAAAVRAVDAGSAEQARERHDGLAKPPGSLGRIEELGVQLAAIARRCPPPVPERASLVVCAGDHGIAERGASAWPSEVTTTMVGAFLRGRASANAIAAAAGAEVLVLDVGVRGELPDHSCLVRARVRPGTADLSRGPAMTREEAEQAVEAGAAVAERLGGAGAEVLLCGDMGIGNTAPAACLVACFTGAAPEEVTGPGAGGPPGHVARKAELVAEALRRNRPDPDHPLDALAAVGGLEHAAQVGIMLGGARAGLPVILDGVASGAAALVAGALCPAALGYLVAGHRSSEPAAGRALAHLRLRPLLDLDLRLGEGTGALLALVLVRAAARVLRDVATLDEVAGAR